MAKKTVVVIRAATHNALRRVALRHGMKLGAMVDRVLSDWVSSGSTPGGFVMLENGPCSTARPGGRNQA